MVALGIGLLYLSYAGGLYGYCLIRGYNVTVKQLFSDTWPPNQSRGAEPIPGFNAPFASPDKKVGKKVG